MIIQGGVIRKKKGEGWKKGFIFLLTDGKKKGRALILPFVSPRRGKGRKKKKKEASSPGP